jgi:hypothetical protein
MSLLVADCPRCGANKITFVVKSQVATDTVQHGWRRLYEVFSICRSCRRPTIFVLGLHADSYVMRETFEEEDGLIRYKDGLNEHFKVEGFINIRHISAVKPPEHLPPELENGFNEGAACLVIGCNNAAAAMFRLCLDLATRPLLPDSEDTTKPQPNTRTRRDLGLRLPWLFDNGMLPLDLRELAKCVREDGNDGAHVGNLTEEGAEDLLDFTVTLLERLITQPKKLELAEARRIERREAARRAAEKR